MECCRYCLYFDDCTPNHKINRNTGFCIDFIENYMDFYFETVKDMPVWDDLFLEKDELEWSEMSYNRFLDNGLDYGEASEWDLYLSAINSNRYDY